MMLISLNQTMLQSLLVSDKAGLLSMMQSKSYFWLGFDGFDADLIVKQAWTPKMSLGMMI